MGLQETGLLWDGSETGELPYEMAKAYAKDRLN
jgi:hypothetical protein